jgi:hypothetical protein
VQLTEAAASTSTPIILFPFPSDQPTMLTHFLLLILIIAVLIGNPELYPNRLTTTLKKLALLLVFLLLIKQHPELAQTKNWSALKELWNEHTK